MNEQHPPLNILFVDDDPCQHTMTPDIIRMALPGATVTQAYDALEAANLMHQKIFDFVISDWSMPKGGGQFVLDAALKLTLNNQQPAIGFVASQGSAVMADALSQGARFFLPKPYDLLILCAHLQGIFNPKRTPVHA